ncbi:hypothetical protein LPJ66_002985, partial [Kickxella alabastrina]
ASYEIYFNDAAGLAKERALISNSKITIHPDFDPRTFANNIAVVRFTGISSSGWSSGVGISADEWNNRWFARSYLQDVQTMTWDEAVIETRLRQSSYCVQTSGIYAANTDSMFCTTTTMSAVGGAQCDIPFSISYAVSLEQIVPAAIFSHTVYYGNQLCDSSRLLHYYTSLANYITFAESVIDRKINLVPNHPDYGYSTNPLFSMAGSVFDTVLGTGTFAGNLFSKSDPDSQGPVTNPTKDTEQDSAPTSKTASEPSSGAGSDSETKPATTAATGTTSNLASPIPAGSDSTFTERSSSKLTSAAMTATTAHTQTADGNDGDHEDNRNPVLDDKNGADAVVNDVFQKTNSGDDNNGNSNNENSNNENSNNENSNEENGDNENANNENGDNENANNENANNENANNENADNESADKENGDNENGADYNEDADDLEEAQFDKEISEYQHFLATVSASMGAASSRTILVTVSGNPTLIVINAASATGTATYLTNNSSETGLHNGSKSASTNDGQSSGLKRSQVIGIAVSMSILGVLLIVGGIFGYKWYCKKRLSTKWTPRAVQQIVETQMVENEMGNIDTTGFHLPNYGNHQQTTFIASGPGSSTNPS